MIWSLEETLNFIEPFLSKELVSPHTFANVKRLARLLPEAMFSYYLECRLDADASQVDFLACAIASNGGREILRGNNGASGLSDTLLENPLWGRIYDFLVDWADPASSLYQQIPLIWLGFDKVDEPPPKVPQPCPSFCLGPEFLQRHRQPQPLNQQAIQKYQQVTETALGHLLGGSMSSRTKQNLFACFDLLPPTGQIFHIGAMLARQPSELKVYGSMPKDLLLDYLKHIGWTGSMIEIEKILTSFGALTDVVRPDLIVGDTISPRLGIEFPAHRYPQDDPAQQFLLEQCVKRGLCTPAKQETLLSWPGSSRVTFRAKPWPATLSKWSHLKIVYWPNRPLEAKIYLGFMAAFSLF